MKNQNLNKGDKILCKNDIHNSRINFTKGIEYYIVAIEHKNDNYDDDGSNYYYYISDDNSQIIVSENERLIYNYFYTNQEVRNMKLKKINDDK